MTCESLSCRGMYNSGLGEVSKVGAMDKTNSNNRPLGGNTYRVTPPTMRRTAWGVGNGREQQQAQEGGTAGGHGA
jgi:hypothetical protein